MPKRSSSEAHATEERHAIEPGDVKRVCKDCTHTFVFTAAEQATFAAKGYAPKQRCKDCIAAKKAKHDEKAEAATATLDATELPKFDDKTEAKLDAWLAAKRSTDYDTADRLRWELRGNNIDPDKARPPGYALLQKAANGGGGNSGGSKKKDGTPGHSSKCFNCGKVGHASSECKQRPSGSTACYHCGKEGHKGRDCPDAPAQADFDPAQARCYSCGKTGHLSRDCAEQSRANTCYTCGEKGHNTRYCPKVQANAKNKKKAKPVGMCHAWADAGRCERGWECYFAHPGGGPTRTTPDEPPV